jgi:hypothetical protein
MSYIKKKQVLGLLEDLSILQYGTPTLKRSTSFSGNPSTGEAILDSTGALNITTLKINTRDNFIGNSYSQLNDISEEDKLVIKDPNSENLAIYSINNITSEVDSSYEGYFILTIQHSFGYNSTFNQGELIYYFRRVPSSSITELILDEQARAIAAEKTLEGMMLGLIQSTSTSSLLGKYTEEIFIESEGSVTINHDLGTEYVIVQAFDSNNAYNFGINIASQDANNITITRQATTDPNDQGDNYKVIIIG